VFDLIERHTSLHHKVKVRSEYAVTCLVSLGMHMWTSWCNHSVQMDRASYELNENNAAW